MKFVDHQELEERSKAFADQDSFWATILTSYLYVINDLRKKKRQFAIGVSTIFLSVTVVTYLNCMIGLAPAVTMIASQATVGDFDIQI